MYFNHAYQKTLINTGPGSNPSGTANFYTSAGTSIDIPAGRVAVLASITTGTFNANQIINTSAAFGTTTIQKLPMIYLAQGSINTLDKLGPFAGGYKESVKTKGINPKYVSKFFRVDPACPQAEIVSVCVCDGGAPQCGTSYYLRVDVKGSPALRFLSHNAYRTFASNNVCCPTDPTASTAIDPMQVQTSWAWQIARDPIMKNFILPILTWDSGAGMNAMDVAAWYAANPLDTDTDLYAYILASGAGSYPFAQVYPDITFSDNSDVYNPITAEVPSTIPCMYMIGAYEETQFGTCSFHPQDFYELAPVKLYPSITDQLGDPCVDQVWCLTDGVVTPKVELGTQGSGYGHKYLRDVILFRRYLQEQYVYDPRLREVMNQDQAYNYILGTSFYTSYGILHSVPRFNNPTGVFDNDQYLVTVVMPPASSCSSNSDVTSFETWMNAYLVAAGNGVQLEVL